MPAQHAPLGPKARDLHNPTHFILHLLLFVQRALYHNLAYGSTGRQKLRLQQRKARLLLKRLLLMRKMLQLPPLHQRQRTTRYSCLQTLQMATRHKGAAKLQIHVD